ncbi:hypothetical protein KIPB_005868 [Kipferlia bialata]|uniref:Uncharacterized protein n=1 Tax=Kipferlia bialata TaxID=797122 RepID=A0A9K3GJD9_9EUKA|nr:hypothetical protein KIPB_005868 [Kipferlia bialata]|eukprot:g5868.t1
MDEFNRIRQQSIAYQIAVIRKRDSKAQLEEINRSIKQDVVSLLERLQSKANFDKILYNAKGEFVPDAAFISQLRAEVAGLVRSQSVSHEPPQPRPSVSPVQKTSWTNRFLRDRTGPAAGVPPEPQLSPIHGAVPRHTESVSSRPQLSRPGTSPPRSSPGVVREGRVTLDTHLLPTSFGPPSPQRGVPSDTSQILRHTTRLRLDTVPSSHEGSALPETPVTPTATVAGPPSAVGKDGTVDGRERPEPPQVAVPRTASLSDSLSASITHTGVTDAARRATEKIRAKKQQLGSLREEEAEAGHQVSSLVHRVNVAKQALLMKRRQESEAVSAQEREVAKEEARLQAEIDATQQRLDTLHDKASRLAARLAASEEILALPPDGDVGLDSAQGLLDRMEAQRQELGQEEAGLQAVIRALSSVAPDAEARATDLLRTTAASDARREVAALFAAERGSSREEARSSALVSALSMESEADTQGTGSDMYTQGAGRGSPGGRGSDVGAAVAFGSMDKEAQLDYVRERPGAQAKGLASPTNDEPYRPIMPVAEEAGRLAPAVDTGDPAIVGSISTGYVSGADGLDGASYHRAPYPDAAMGKEDGAQAARRLSGTFSEGMAYHAEDQDRGEGGRVGAVELYGPEDAHSPSPHRHDAAAPMPDTGYQYNHYDAEAEADTHAGEGAWRDQGPEWEPSSKGFRVYERGTSRDTLGSTAVASKDTFASALFGDLPPDVPGLEGEADASVEMGAGEGEGADTVRHIDTLNAMPSASVPGAYPSGPGSHSEGRDTAGGDGAEGEFLAYSGDAEAPDGSGPSLPSGTFEGSAPDTHYPESDQLEMTYIDVERAVEREVEREVGREGAVDTERDSFDTGVSGDVGHPSDRGPEGLGDYSSKAGSYDSEHPGADARSERERDAEGAYEPEGGSEEYAVEDEPSTGEGHGERERGDGTRPLMATTGRGHAFQSRLMSSTPSQIGRVGASGRVGRSLSRPSSASSTARAGITALRSDHTHPSHPEAEVGQRDIDKETDPRRSALERIRHRQREERMSRAKRAEGRGRSASAHVRREGGAGVSDKERRERDRSKERREKQREAEVEEGRRRCVNRIMKRRQEKSTPAPQGHRGTPEETSASVRDATRRASQRVQMETERALEAKQRQAEREQATAARRHREAEAARVEAESKHRAQKRAQQYREKQRRKREQEEYEKTKVFRERDSRIEKFKKSQAERGPRSTSGMRGRRATQRVGGPASSRGATSKKGRALSAARTRPSGSEGASSAVTPSAGGVSLRPRTSAPLSPPLALGQRDRGAYSSASRPASSSKGHTVRPVSRCRTDAIVNPLSVCVQPTQAPGVSGVSGVSGSDLPRQVRPSTSSAPSGAGDLDLGASMGLDPDLEDLLNDVEDAVFE